MPAARYWRIVGVETYAGGDLEISALHLHDAGGRVDAGAVITCSHAPVSGTLDALQDTDLATSCRFSGVHVRSGGFALHLDIGSAKDVTGIRIGSADVYERYLAGFTLQYWDGAGWVVSGSINRAPWPGPASLGALLPVSSFAAVYWRLWITENNGDAYTSLQELRLFAGSSTVTYNGMVTGQSSYFDAINNTAGRLVNGELVDFVYNVWVSATGANLPHWVSFRLDSAAKVTGLQLWPQNYAGGPSRAPKSFALQSSSNGENWVDRLTVTGASDWTAGVPKTWVVHAPDGAVAPFVHTGMLKATEAASSDVPAFATMASRSQLARDIEFGGAGTVYGTTKTKGAPNLPTKARVVLLHQRSKQPVREVWSDPITGAFVFEGIDTTQQFLTLAEDAAGNFRPVAASRLVPEVQA